MAGTFTFQGDPTFECGESVKVTRSLFQVGEGGAVPTSPHQFKIGECTFSEVRTLFERFHYKAGHMGGGITMCLALYLSDFSVMSAYGGAVLGKLRQEKAYKSKGRTIELRRMACHEDAPKNSESYFLSKIIWWVGKMKMADSIISYSDLSVGHKGTIYKAANFKLIGKPHPQCMSFGMAKDIIRAASQLNVRIPISSEKR